MNDRKSSSADLADYHLFNHILSFYKYRIADESALLQETLPLFIHEYTHFYLQFNTLFNIEGILNYFMHIKELRANKPIYNKTPENISEKFRTITERIKQWQHRCGSTKMINLPENDISKIKIELSQMNVNSHIFEFDKKPDAYLFLLDCNDGNILCDDILLGEHIINESIASVFEVLPKRDKNRDWINMETETIPYELFFLLAERNNYDLLILTFLGIISLSFPTPGFHFQRLITKYQKELEYTKDSSDYTKILADITKNEYQSHEFISYFDFLESVFEEILLPSITASSPYQYLANMISRTFRRIKERKLPELFHLFADKNPEIALHEIMQEFPPGIIIDKNGFEMAPNTNNLRYIFLDRGESPAERSDRYSSLLFFRGLFSIYDSFKSNTLNFQCPNYKICDYPFRDAECGFEPWRKSQLENTCEVGRAAYEFGFGSVI